MTSLTRYHRQMLLQGIGETGQRHLREAKVMVLGCGALGSVVADLLARAGVGTLVIVDRDLVELTNLQRQVLFDEDDVAAARPKAEAARRRIAHINADVKVVSIVDDINQSNIESFAEGADLLVDGLDNFDTRYLANDYAVKHGVPYVYGAAVGTSGMAFTVLPHSGAGSRWPESAAGPCLRCLFDEPPPVGTTPTCDTVGVLAPAVGMVANYQVAQSIKVLTRNFADLEHSLMNVDVWSQQLMTLDVSKARDSGDCPCCVHGQYDWLEGRAGTRAESLCGRDAVQLRPAGDDGVTDLESVATRLAGHGKVRKNDLLVQATVTDSGHDFELTVFANGRAIVKGTDEIAVARSVIARFVGA